MKEKEFHIIVDLYADRLGRFAYKLLNDRDQAKDTVQETFTKLWENRYKIKPEKTKSWLFTVAYNDSMATIKKQKRFVHDFEMEKESFEMDTNDLKTILKTSLELLSDTQKAILLLKDYEGYNYNEIGEILDLNDSQVKVYLFRARKKMKNYLKDLDLVY